MTSCRVYFDGRICIALSGDSSRRNRAGNPRMKKLTSGNAPGGWTSNAALTKAPVYEATMADLDVTKKQRFITFCTSSTPHSRQSWDTVRCCSEPEFSSPNLPALQGFAQELQAESTRNSWRPCTKSSLMTGAGSARSGKHGTKNWRTLTTFSFMPKSEEKNSPNSARSPGASDRAEQTKQKSTRHIRRVFSKEYPRWHNGPGEHTFL